MSNIEWLVSETKWFIKASKTYMQGEKVTPFRAVKAYISYMFSSHKDFKAGIYTPVEKRQI